METSWSLDEKFISNIFEKYRKAKIILKKENSFSLQEKETYYGQSKGSTNLDNYYQYVQIVDTILSLLPKEEYTCLIRDFLKSGGKQKAKEKEWWKKFYSQEKYQKLRIKAINRFLYLFLI